MIQVYTNNVSGSEIDQDRRASGFFKKEIEDEDATNIVNERPYAIDRMITREIEEEEEIGEEAGINFQRDQQEQQDEASYISSSTLKRLSRRKLSSKHHNHHYQDDDGVCYPRYKVTEYDEDRLKMKLTRVYPRVVFVDDGDGGVDVSGDNDVDDGGFKKTGFKMKIIFE